MLNTVDYFVRTSATYLVKLVCLVALVFSGLVFADTIPSDANLIRPILIGQTVPQITLIDQDSKPFALNEALAKKPTLLIFYRGGWCPYCNRHLADLRKIEATLLKKGFQIFAISPDLPEYLNTTATKHKLGFKLLSDAKMEASKAMGLAFELDPQTLELYKSYHIDLEKQSGQSHHLLPAPAAFLVNTEGQVVFSFVSPDYKIRVDSEVVLAAANALLKSQAAAKALLKSKKE